MKKTIYIAVATIILLQLTACNEEEKLLYSCDAETNAWVEDNLVEIQQMKWSDVIPLPDGQQRACYAAFTPQQRYNVWLDKLVDVRNISLRHDQIQHIDVLLAKMKVNWFDEATKKDAELFAEIELFLEQWINDACKLGWTQDELGRIGTTLNKVEIKDNTIVIKRFEQEDASRWLYNCSCNKYDDWCSGAMTCQGDYACRAPSAGCGWFLLLICDGTCQPPYLNTTYIPR